MQGGRCRRTWYVRSARDRAGGPTYRSVGERGRLRQTMAVGERRRLRAGGKTEFAEDVGDVGRHRAPGDAQHLGDLVVCPTGGDEAEDLAFASGQTAVNGDRRFAAF